MNWFWFEILCECCFMCLFIDAAMSEDENENLGGLFIRAARSSIR